METKQTGWLIIIVMASAISLMFGLSFLTRMPDDEVKFLYIVASLLVIPALLFYQLTIVVDYQEIKIRFGIGLIHKSWQLEKIEKATAVKTNLLQGWGIHYSLNTTIYNVTGFKAVELNFKNSKRKVRIGCNEPEKLADYINRMVAQKQ
ncbi:MAG: hypothetical protein IPH20_05725 [Bacteroidales bacterium]|nr:hypothetical protein [Bacteroidales bacterium]